MIALVLIACLKTPPAQCAERVVATAVGLGLMQRMLARPPLVAAWSDKNPGLTIQRWFCRDASVTRARAT